MNKVRIISGSLKGRYVSFDDNVGLRPTLGRVRETLFSWLESEIWGANCLDLFAGSGSLGFEAISRGAKNVVMVEKDQHTCSILEGNALRMGVKNINVLQGSYETLVEDIFNYGPYDIVFCDPPYGVISLDKVLSFLINENIVKYSSRCFCEWSLQSSPNFSSMYNVIKLKKAGNVGFALLKYQSLRK